MRDEAVAPAAAGATGAAADDPAVALAARGLRKLFAEPGATRRVAGLAARAVGAGGTRGRAVHAVDGVDLTLHRGEVLALVGESGSGKSTVAKLLALLIPRSDGDIRLAGTSVSARVRRAFRRYSRRVQLIFQDPFASLNPVHTVRYTLTRSVRIHQGRLRGARLEQALTGLLDRVQLRPPASYLDKFPHELSGGQRQRVAIARTLAADPEVLLADEPISMLDVSIRLGILNLLRQLRDDMRLAILYITHDIASARYFADRTAVMYAGRIVETGDSEAVTQQPAHPYTRLLVSSAPDPDQLAGTGGPGATGTAHGAGGAHGTAHGEAPSLVTPPPGCRFHPRCRYATDLCSAASPPLLDLGGGRAAACWGHAPDKDGAPVLDFSVAAAWAPPDQTPGEAGPARVSWNQAP